MNNIVKKIEDNIINQMSNYKIKFYLSNGLRRITNVKNMDKSLYAVYTLNHTLYSPDAKYSDKVSNLIFTIMLIFAEMGAYPDCFFDPIFPLYFKARKEIEDIGDVFRDKVKARKRDEVRIDYEAKIENVTVLGKEQKKYIYINQTPTDPKEQYKSVTEYLQKLGIECGNVAPNEAFDVIRDRCGSIISRYGRSDTIYEDIINLTKLLCECYRYFALVGEDPTERIEGLIDKYDHVENLKKYYEYINRLYSSQEDDLERQNRL